MGGGALQGLISLLLMTILLADWDLDVNHHDHSALTRYIIYSTDERGAKNIPSWHS